MFSIKLVNAPKPKEWTKEDEGINQLLIETILFLHGYELYQIHKKLLK